MADRWGGRSPYDARPSREDDRDRNERGTMDRATDEVRSWFGDDEAERRRRMDEARDDRYDRNRDWSDRARDAGERAWDRTREQARDLTDRDRDGRRGLAEWRDDNRDYARGYDRNWGDRPEAPARYYGSSSSTGAAMSRASETPYTRDRGFEDRNRDWSGVGYAGRGPRGYQRADARIFEEVCDRLTEDHRIDASDIEVQVNGGEVTLSGSVRSRDEKRYAEDLAERISGVREVSNNLKLRRTDQVIGTARSGASVLGLTDTPPPPPEQERKK